MDKPTRTAYKYIEEFKEYELSFCIAYEMMIRNNDFINDFKIFMHKLAHLEEEFKKDNGKSYFELRKKLENKYFFNLSSKHFTFLCLRGYDFLNPSSLKEAPSIANNLQSCKNSGNVKANNEYTSFLMQKENLTNPKIEREVGSFFSRPKLCIVKRQSKEFTIKINPNIPIKENIEYLKKVLEHHTNNKSFIKSPLELLGEELEIDTIDIKKSFTAKEWADIFFIYDFWKHTKGAAKDKYHDLEEILTKYHGYRIEKPASQIKAGYTKYKLVPYEVYHKLKPNGNYKGKKIKPYYSISTLKNRLKLIQSLIDDLKYKTLLT